MKIPYSTLLIILTLPLVLGAQKEFVQNISLHPHYGFVFAHNQEVQFISGARPFGIAAEYAVLKFDSASYNLAACYPKTGISLMYFDYNSAILGHSWQASYFLEPSYAITNRWLLAFRGGLGVSYLTNPYHPVRNPNNNNYSLPVNLFFHFALTSNFRITRNLGINLSANFFHISNGGIFYPNSGINWPTANLGLQYKLNDTEFRKRRLFHVRHAATSNRFDLGVYSSLKNPEKGFTKPFFVPGMFAAYHRQFTRLHTLGLTIDFHADYSLSALQKHLNESENYHFFSLAVDHEFLLGKFIFWQQAGYYILPPDDRFPHWYHRWGLNFRVAENFTIGGGVKVHNFTANVADLRVMYTLRR